MIKEPISYPTNFRNNLRTCQTTSQSQCKRLETNSSYLQAATFSQQSHDYSNRNKKSRLSSFFVSGSRKSQSSTQSSKENLPSNQTSSISSHSSSCSSQSAKKTRSSSNSSLSTASSLGQSPPSSRSSSSSNLKHKKTNESSSLNADEMQQRSSVLNLRVRKLGHVETSEEEIVYKWLEKNPSFVFEFFVSHATRFMVDQWLIRQRKLNTNGLLDDQQHRECQRTNRSASELLANGRKSSLDPRLLAGNNSLLMRSYSCCDTPATHKHISSPMRKISARHFENSTISLEPIFRRTSEGKPSFLPLDKSLHSISLSPKKHLFINRLSNSLSSQISECRNDSMITNHHFEKPHNSRSQSEQTINKSSLIQKTPDEVKLMLELIQEIVNNLDIRSICHKILKNISILTNADRCSLFLVQENANEKFFASILFDVKSDSEYNDTKQTCIRVPWNSGIVGYVAKVRKCENIRDCYSDERFNSEVDSITGYFTKNMLCAPIEHNGKVIGVAQAINKKSPETKDYECFTSCDEEIFQHFLQFCGIGLRNAQLYEQKYLENRRNQVLLDLATMIFEQQTTIEEIVKKVMVHTQSLLKVERCQVLLLQDYDEEEQQWSNLINYYNHKYLASDDLNNFPSQLTQLDEPNEDRQPNFTRKFDLEAVFEPVKCARCAAASNQIQNVNKVNLYNDEEETLTSFTTDSNYDSHPLNVGITNCVAKTGQTLNILDCQQDPRFDVHIDQLINEERKRQLNIDCPDCLRANQFQHKHVLCMPIRNGQRKIIGVTQMINKLNDEPFTANDESLFEAFAIFIGMGIQSTLNYENSMKANAKHHVTLQSLSYHCSAPDKAAVRLSERATPMLKQVSQREINDLMQMKLMRNEDAQMITEDSLMAVSGSGEIIDVNGKRRKNFFVKEFDRLVCYLPLTYVDEDFFKSDQSLLVSIKFFEDLNLVKRFNINYKTLCRWLLSVQKNYRPVCYHNWRHAFEVAEMMFSILSSGGLAQYLDDYEVLSLMIACFCHDLDHRGTNNKFESKNSSPLHHLYSTSTMEHHHFDCCIMILNSPGNQILSNLDTQEYRNVVDLIERAILATDLDLFFKNKRHFTENINNFTDVFKTTDNKYMFMAMLMTLCDLNAISKPWPLQRETAELVSREFFTQGDIEKHIFNEKPMDMFNREKRDELPKMQVEFINLICQPIYTQFERIFNGDFPYRDYMLINKFNWLRLASESEHLKDWAASQQEQFLRELEKMKGVDVNALQQEAYEAYEAYEANERKEQNC